MPDRESVGPRVLDPPFEDADWERARFEVAGDHRAQLLADEADAQDVGLERLPGAREERVVGAGTLGQGPAPVGQDVPVAGSTGPLRSPSRVVAPADEDREAVRRDRLERVLADLEMPSGEVAPMRPPDAAGPQPADRDAAPRTVIDHRGRHLRPAGVGAGQADRPTPCDVGDPRGRSVGHGSLLDAGDDDAAHECPLGEEEDHDRHRDRHDRAGLDQRDSGRRRARRTAGRRASGATGRDCRRRRRGRRKNSFQP